MSALFTDTYNEEGTTAIGFANGTHSLFISVQIRVQTVNPFKTQNILLERRHSQNGCLSKFISYKFNTERKVKLSL